jgi:hypothetical protein
VLDKSARKDGSSYFSYNQANDVYLCPGGKTLTTPGRRVNDIVNVTWKPAVSGERYQWSWGDNNTSPAENSLLGARP